MKFRILLTITIVAMTFSIPLALYWAPAAAILGESSRILYFHVPVAWVSVIAFVTAGGYSIAHLVDRQQNNDYYARRAYNAALIGIWCTIVTVISGSLWAKVSWGSYWNWDPRERSIVLLLLVYLAYFVLHSSLGKTSGGSRITAVYLIMAMVAMPILVFVIPRIYPSLHPDTVINAQREVQLATEMRIVLAAMTVSFTLLYSCILILLNRLSAVEQRIEEYYHAI